MSSVGSFFSYLNDARSHEPEATISFVMSFRLSAWNNSAPSGWNFRKFDIWVFFESLSRIFKFHQNLTRITGTAHEDQFTLLIISRSALLRIGNASDKSRRENQNTHFVFKNVFPTIVPFMGQCGKILHSGSGRRWQ